MPSAIDRGNMECVRQPVERQRARERDDVSAVNQSSAEAPRPFGVLVEMNAAIDAEYLPLARRIAVDENVVLNDTQLLAAIAGNNGSFRSVIFSVLRLAKRTARQSASAANIAAATIQQASAKK